MNVCRYIGKVRTTESDEKMSNNAKWLRVCCDGNVDICFNKVHINRAGQEHTERAEYTQKLLLDIRKYTKWLHKCGKTMNETFIDDMQGGGS